MWTRSPSRELNICFNLYRIQLSVYGKSSPSPARLSSPWARRASSGVTSGWLVSCRCSVLPGHSCSQLCTVRFSEQITSSARTATRAYLLAQSSLLLIYITCLLSYLISGASAVCNRPDCFTPFEPQCFASRDFVMRCSPIRKWYISLEAC